jgi:hypothetical protein
VENVSEVELDVVSERTCRAALHATVLPAFSEQTCYFNQMTGKLFGISPYMLVEGNPDAYEAEARGSHPNHCPASSLLNCVAKMSQIPRVTLTKIWLDALVNCDAESSLVVQYPGRLVRYRLRDLEDSESGPNGLLAESMFPTSVSFSGSSVRATALFDSDRSVYVERMCKDDLADLLRQHIHRSESAMTYDPEQRRTRLRRWREWLESFASFTRRPRSR